MITANILFLCLLLLFFSNVLSAHNHEELATVASSASAVFSSCQSEDNATVDVIRGGGVSASCDVDDNTRNTILNFLDSSFKETADEDYPFHVQGMRWHFMSLLRDSKRLERLAKQLLANVSDNNDNEGDINLDVGFDALEQAANYVVNFNMAGFFRIQNTLFVHFLRKHLCETDSIRPFIEGGDAVAETDAFEKMVGKVEEYRVQSETVGNFLYERAKAASDASSSVEHKRQLLCDVTRSSRQLLDQLAPMENIQETLIVPAISRVVRSKVQKSFNNKVLLNLGLLDSRLHLVGMHDAVWESGIEDEMKRFEKEIPYVARIMIERWRRSLYIPKAGALDYGRQNSV